MGGASNDIVSVKSPSNAVGQAFEWLHADRLEQMKPDALRRIHQTKVSRYLRIRSLDQRDELLPFSTRRPFFTSSRPSHNRSPQAVHTRSCCGSGVRTASIVGSRTTV